MSKTKLTVLISGISAFVGVLLIATFFDLQINIALGNSNSLFGQFFENLGDSPAYLIAPIAFVILYQAITKENKLYLVLKITFGILELVGFAAFYYYFTGNFFVENLQYKYVYIVFFAAISTIITILATNKIDKQLMKKLAIFAVFMIAVLAISQILTVIAKGLWGRLRFRNMNANYDGFTPWYKMNFGASGREDLVVSYPGHDNDDAFKSCPSGHTSSAAITFVLIMLPELFEKLKKYKLWFYIIPVVYTILVAVSRIVAKAHFLSDVLFGATITILTVIFAKWLVYKLEKFIRVKLIR